MSRLHDTTIEMSTPSLARRERQSPPSWKLLTTCSILGLIPTASSYTTNPYFEKNAFPGVSPPRLGPPMKRDGNQPLNIVNMCPDTIWPGIGTQKGTGAGTGGFELASGATKQLTVSGDWQGRVWGRTNCSFNMDGTGASNLNGQDGSGAACTTGDCGGVLSCVLTGATPVNLAEFALTGGVDGNQVFYDISLVDGYNIPLGIIYLPGDDPAFQDIPPNLTNCQCIATAGSLAPPAYTGTNGNATTTAMPLPLEGTETSDTVAGWCPWDLQQTQPTKPGDGVYPYPDDKIQRPIFDPCLSACSKTNAPSDCCTGSYFDPKVCKPNLYSTSAKTVCPDAYSFAFDDQTSTFIIPAGGGGWQVTFCPPGRSTNILATMKPQLEALSQSGGKVTKAIIDACTNVTWIKEAAAKSDASESGVRMGGPNLGALVVVVAWGVLW